MNQTDKNVLIITSSVLIFIFLGLLTFFFISQNRIIPSISDNNLSNSNANFSKFTSCQDMSNEIYEYLTECQENNNCNQSIGFRSGLIPETTIQSDSSFGMPESRSSTSAQMNFSSTNNQVLNVDEGDFVKTNGKYIFKAVNGSVSITKILPDGQMELLQSIYPKEDLGDNLKIHINKDKLILMGNGYENNVLVYIYNISENAIEYNSVDLLKSFSIEGNISETRLVNGNIFIITNKYTDFYNLFIKDNYTEPNPIFQNNNNISQIKKPLNSNELNNLLPKKNDSPIQCSDINIISPITNLNSITTIVGIDTNDINQEIFTESILGSGESIYMSDKNLYLANSIYNYNSNLEKTDFFRFKLSNNKAIFDKKTTLIGNLINQFSMDEYNDNFRVAMTKRSNTGSQESLNNTITILDKDFNKAGEITGLARGEKIYSTRFMGDKGYIVTFRETDPLFTFDLSDPKNPKTVGELKIPGFSNYLHPIKNGDYLIGVGKDSDNNGIVKGVKISLFDVRGLQTAKEVGVITVGDTGSYSEVDNDHKALLWDDRNDLLTIPISESSNTSTGTISNRFSRSEQYQGSYFYKVNLEKGFEILGKTSHNNTLNQTYSTDIGNEIKRQLYIDSSIFTISQNKIESLNIENILNKNIQIKSSIEN